MKRIVTRADVPTVKRSAGLLNPASNGSTSIYRQPWDTRIGASQADREAMLATITSAIARDTGDVTRFETRAYALGTDEEMTERSPYAYALNIAASVQMTASAFWQAYALAILFAGECYVIEQSGTLTPLIGGTVEVLVPARNAVNVDGSPMLVAGYRIRNAAGVVVAEYGPDGTARAGATPGSRLHRTWLPHPETPLRANPPLAAAQLPTEVLHTLRQATKSILVNDGMPAGILTVTDPTVDDESITSLETRLNTRLSDPNRKGRTLVVDASVAYQSLGNTVLDGDWVNVAQSFRDELLAVFRTPPSVLGQVAGMTYENQSVAMRAYRSQVILPLRQMLLDTLNIIARGQGYYLATDMEDGAELDELQEAEQKLRKAQRVEIMRTTGLATVNELRDELGLPPVPGGDVIPALQLPVAPAPANDTNAPDPQSDATRQALPKVERAANPEPRETPDLNGVEGTHFEKLAIEVQRFMSRIYRNAAGAVRRITGDADKVPAIDVAQVFDDVARAAELADDLTPLMELAASDTAAEVAGALDVPVTERWREIVTQRMNQLVEGYEGRPGVTRELADEIGDALRAAFENGESIDGAMGRIAGVLGVDPADPGAVGYRAERIARTELLSIMNGSSYAQAEASGVRLSKRWVATSDARTRAEHAALDGKTIPMAAKFSVGGIQADGPHASGLPASQVVNCRCRLVFVPVE